MPCFLWRSKYIFRGWSTSWIWLSVDFYYNPICFAGSSTKLSVRGGRVIYTSIHFCCNSSLFKKTYIASDARVQLLLIFLYLPNKKQRNKHFLPYLSLIMSPLRMSWVSYFMASWWVPDCGDVQSIHAVLETTQKASNSVIKANRQKHSLGLQF